MDSLIESWSRGYARQALSDLKAREILARANAPKCHRLHFLQMATEKACKAFRREGEMRTHTLVERVLPQIARHFIALLYQRNAVAEWEMSQIKKLAREIQFLAPGSSEGEARWDNSEYPWIDGQGEVRIPCEYQFPNIDDSAKNRSIVLLIKLIRAAAETYAVAQ